MLLTACSNADPEANSDPTKPATTATVAEALETAGSAVGATDEDMQRYYDQQISFGECAEFATNDAEDQTFANDAFECGWLTVPLDYQDPGGEEAQIAVLRAPARGEPIGSLVVNPGGPGKTGTYFAAYVSEVAKNNPTTQKFDIVGFDPRGTGASKPALDCFDDAEREDDAVVFPFIAGGEHYTEKQTQALAEQCARRSGGEEVLANAGTRNVARDMDVLRAALGDDKLTYLGDSWGTRLGAVYAEMYPDNVRAMILDGALDPTQTWRDRAPGQFAAFQNSFESLAELCAAGPDCPLGDDATQATGRFQQLVRPLIEQPLPAGRAPAPDGSVHQRFLSARGAVDAMAAGLYDKDGWPIVIDALRQLRAGRGDAMLAIRDGAQDRRASDGSYSNHLESTTAVYCADEERLSPQEATLMRRTILRAAPFMDLGESVETRDGCEHWPNEPTLKFPYAEDIEGLPTLMVVSVTGDPATPYQDGVGLAEQLDARLLTVEGDVHGATLRKGNACTDDYAADYLINLTLPPADARCRL